ncbi:N-acetyl sugar amidotransferase [uncultured Ruthenibacterium sp.]|uniref:N-acetyl sugar amidotransferase n=1 Tax=uncultured Ruthenibacterium sp. TaxID=1905347 RepID=UPI00349E63D5
MKKLPRYVSIDYAQYAPEIPDEQRKTFYGLPQNVQFCNTCVMSNQKPNSCYEFEHTIHSIKKTMVIQQDGVCDACHACQNKEGKIDWDDRERQLRELCERYRRTDGGYDCLVPGSGGKDSFYAAHLLKYKYGMHPLTVTWAPHIYTPWGWKNFEAWIHAGFDNYLCTPNGLTHRLLTRLATENLFHPFQPFILGQKQLAPKMAAKFGIPLVFYGENEAEFGNPIADNDSALRDERFFSTNDFDHIYLGGVSLRQLQEDFGIDKADLAIYLPCETSDVEKNHIQVHYMGYYEKWHPQGAYYYSVEHGGFVPSPERTAGTYSKYNSIDDKVDDFFYYTTYIKYGVGRCTYDAAQEIRNKEITREEGVALCKKYDGEFPMRFADEIFRYLSIDKQHFGRAADCFEQPEMDLDYFMHLADRFRSPHLWQYADGHWSLRHTPFEGPSSCGYGDPRTEERQ